MLFGVGENYAARANQNTQLVVTFVQERWSACCHLVEQDAKGPPVDSEAVATHIKDLRSQVLGSSTEGKCLVFGLKELGQAEIGETDISIVVHEHILWLKVTMHDVSSVQVT